MPKKEYVNEYGGAISDHEIAERVREAYDLIADLKSQGYTER